MRISYWSSDVCSSDLFALERETLGTIPDDVCLCSYRFPIIKARNVQVAPDCVGYGFRQLRCRTPHERCCNARIGCETIEMLGLQLLQCPGSTERHCKAWRQLGPDQRADQIIERSEDSRNTAVFQIGR